MSDTSTAVTPEYFQYIAERTAREDSFLRELKSAATAAGMPPIWIAPEQASLMQILLRAVRARDVVEIGTLAGYSAINMARALPADGMVRTIELDPARATFARGWAARSDVAGKVEVIQGAGADVLATLANHSADAAFLDADKPSYPLYLKECLRIVRRGGLIMADNAFAFGRLFEENADSDVQAVRDFNDLMAKTPEVQSVIVPIGDGLWVGVRR
jgi:predicted O-methyltransferase YrrM